MKIPGAGTKPLPGGNFGERQTNIDIASLPKEGRRNYGLGSLNWTQKVCLVLYIKVIYIVCVWYI